MIKVAVGLSGGVDSGTTALMLKEQGYDVIGVTMWLFDHQSAELVTAKRVADAIGIKHHIMDYRSIFKSKIIDAFLNDYAQGFTPNPCILCNRHLKYGKLIEDSVALGATYFATGHYAKCQRIEKTQALGVKGEFQILRAENRKKDQSYNLYHLSQEVIGRLLFPLGSAKSKEEVRNRFSALNLELSEKKDSLGICFIEHKNHTLFLAENKSPSMTSGSFLSTSGELLGYHNGTGHFTIGQKRRLGKDLNGQYLNGKYVVVSIHPESGQVILGSETDLMYDTVSCHSFNIISPSLRDKLLNGALDSIRVEVVLSQWSEVYSGILRLHADQSSDMPRATLSFEIPVRAPAKGQALVCYKDDVLIGGGLIED